MDKEKLIKDIECATCERIFKCEGKPEKVEHCLMYQEREKQNARYKANS